MLVGESDLLPWVAQLSVHQDRPERGKQRALGDP
jgi:hypothetical protein